METGGALDHNAYYPGARELAIRNTGDTRPRRCADRLANPAEVAKRIDIIVRAIFAGLSVDALSDLDLS